MILRLRSSRAKDRRSERRSSTTAKECLAYFKKKNNHVLGDKNSDETSLLNALMELNVGQAEEGEQEDLIDVGRRGITHR